jgi:hypothetical protein
MFGRAEGKVKRCARIILRYYELFHGLLTDWMELSNFANKSNISFSSSASFAVSACKQ